MNPDEALAAAIEAHVESTGQNMDYAAVYIRNARAGFFRYQNPIGPEYIGLTANEFTALRMLIYNN